ncbi:MAG: alpha/beta fold hydrolase [Pigmentiphaga sp.]|nr:alpha/beta fold hydrolase [Pigmentiphaga sp.]
MNHTTFVLVHGAWQGSWSYSPLSRQLTAAGHQVLRIDLPGHGLDARFIPAYHTGGGERAAALQTEKSPVAAVGLQAYVDAIGETLEAAHRTRAGSVVLVAHSMAGIPATAAIEAHPHRVDAIAYLAAFLPPPGMAGGACSALPQNEGSLIPSVVIADPATVGALRLDPLSANADYAALLKQTFAAEVDEGQWSAVRHLMTPDTPIQPLATPLAYTAERWGSKRRLYVRCTHDYAVRPALQDFFIEQADTLAPGNSFKTVSMASGHLPFLSKTQEVAEALIAFGTGNS